MKGFRYFNEALFNVNILFGTDLEECMDSSCFFEGIEWVGLYFSLGVEFIPNNEDLGIGFIIVLRLGKPIILKTLSEGMVTSKVS